VVRVLKWQKSGPNMDFIKASCDFYFVLILYTFRKINFGKVTKSMKNTKTELEQADIKVSKGPP
jgi:hypothetical protein